MAMRILTKSPALGSSQKYKRMIEDLHSISGLWLELAKSSSG